MWKTVVSFASTYQEIYIDGCYSCEWEPVQTVFTLAKLADTPQAERKVMQHLPAESNAIQRALRSMEIRVRYDGKVKGPFIIDSEEKPTDEELIAWAKRNVYGHR